MSKVISVLEKMASDAAMNSESAIADLVAVSDINGAQQQAIVTESVEALLEHSDEISKIKFVTLKHSFVICSSDISELLPSSYPSSHSFSKSVFSDSAGSMRSTLSELALLLKDLLTPSIKTSASSDPIIKVNTSAKLNITSLPLTQLLPLRLQPPF